MSTQTKRQGVHAYLSDVALDALHLFTAENGISVTSYLEQVALDLADEMTDAGSSDVQQDVVRRCRKTDAARRRR